MEFTPKKTTTTIFRRERMKGKICKDGQKEEEELLVVLFGTQSVWLPILYADWIREVNLILIGCK